MRCSIKEQGIWPTPEKREESFVFVKQREQFTSSSRRHFLSIYLKYDLSVIFPLNEVHSTFAFLLPFLSFLRFSIFSFAIGLHVCNKGEENKCQYYFNTVWHFHNSVTLPFSCDPWIKILHSQWRPQNSNAHPGLNFHLIFMISSYNQYLILC